MVTITTMCNLEIIGKAHGQATDNEASVVEEQSGDVKDDGDC